MADMKKEQERDELHRAIWAIADELRGAVDGWDFKNYVLGTMFYRYISENLESYINRGEWDAGNTDFRYADMPDSEAEEARAGLVEEKGFFILPSELFCNVRKNAPQDENLNETLEAVFRHIEESAKGSQSESSFEGLFDDYDVNSNKLGATVAKRNEKLVKLLNGVAEMNLGEVKDHDIDAFGDAYEYLMTMYASNAGKSGGEFFTPADVSELLTRLGTVDKTEINKVYDPACGSGSLLLKAEKVLGRDAIRNGFFGQEINITTYNLCRINMFLHHVGFDKFDIACEDTLTVPQHWDDEPFELIVSNPPYSIKWAGDDDPILINDPRFSPAGVLAPKSKEALIKSGCADGQQIFCLAKARNRRNTLCISRFFDKARRKICRRDARRDLFRGSLKQTWPLSCTPCPGWPPTGRRLSSASPASCTGAAQSRKSGSTWWITILLTA